MVETRRYLVGAAALVVCCAAAARAETLRYWVDPCTNQETGCLKDDPDLAQWALEAWAAASDGKLKFEKASRAEQAQIRIHWVTPREGLYGEARGGDVYVRPDGGQGLLRETITYLTCLHETGHALGLSHTAEFADIMYNFQFGGDVTEYFARYRRKLASRDDIRENSGLSAADRQRLVKLFMQ